MTAAVFDTAALAERRRALFPRAQDDAPADTFDRERYGSAERHCGICPKPAHESCGLSCEAQRQTIADGVTVT